MSEQINLDCQNNKEVFWLMKLEARGRQASVQFSCSVMSDSLRSHGLQHTRLPCPSPTPGACSDSCPLSRWFHSTMSFCHPLLLLPSILPRIRLFSNESALRIRWPKYWSFSISLSNENQGWFSLGLSGLINLLFKRLLRVFLLWANKCAGSFKYNI